MSLWNSYLRWRHSKGYGVHSPFAYRFVINVLRPGHYGYYSYWEIDNQLIGKEKRDYKFQNLIKFTIRLAIFLKTKRIIASPESRLADIVAKSLKISRATIKNTKDFKFQDGDMVIIERADVALLHLDEAIKEHIPIFAINPIEEIRDILETRIKRGLLLNDKKRIILIPRNEMAYISYSISL